VAKIARFSKKARRVLFLSDEHCGHVAGLTHPDYNITYTDESDDGAQKRTRRIKQTKQRRVLWDWFAERVNMFRPFDVVVNNGDAVDGRGERSGGTELLCTNPDEQCEMAEAVLDFVCGGKSDLYMVYGTGYHTGKAEDWEDIVAREAHAKKIEGEGHYEINGLHFAVKHFIGNTRSPASRYTALSNAQIRQWLWAARGQQPKANIIVRSHVHRCLYAGEPGTQSLALTTPGLQGLGSKYGVRQCDGLPVEFGFVVFDVLSVDQWAWYPIVSPLNLQGTTATSL